MIDLEDRQEHARDIESARQAAARLHQACEVVGITACALRRWNANQGLELGDGRPAAVRPMPTHALTEAERSQALSLANELDEDVYIAS